MATRFARVVDPLTKEHFTILGCPNCGFGQTDPMPADLSVYYETGYYGSRHSFTETFCNQRVGIVRDLMRGRTGSLLDIGCGQGTFMLAARQRGWNVCGVDVQIETAQAQGLRVWSTLEEANDAAPYDCITLWHSLEHLPDPQESARAIRNLLAPNGILIVAVPDARGLQARVFGPNWFHLDVPRHMFHYSQNALKILLKSIGLDICRRWHVEAEYDLFGWIQSALNSLLGEPNALFQAITQHRRPLTGRIIASFIIAIPLLLIAVPATIVSAIVGLGGTIILAARKQDSAPH